jgi:nuclease S1
MRLESAMPGRSRSLFIANVVSLVLLCPVLAWCWGTDGHKIVALIAADNLTPAARSHVANILGVSSDQRAIASAMEKASMRPDFEFRDEYPSTAPWHFINICLQDRRSDVASRCHGGNCVTAKIDEYSKRMKDAKYDRFGADGDLAFLIHFVGDIHQPLHAANDADKGGNCVKVDSHSQATDLHAVWDTTVVRRLERSIDSSRFDTTARKLEKIYVAEKESDSWISADDIAWESVQLARAGIYTPLQIPVEPCEPAVDTCTNAPRGTFELSSAYLDHADDVAGHQLAKAGFRLASLLNNIWLQPINSSDSGNQAASANPSASSLSAAPGAVISVAPGAIIGNRRSKIYAWPGCGTYDRMSPENRVVFPTREAAEQAGYRAALNCP